MRDSRIAVFPLPGQRRKSRGGWRPHLLRLRGAVADDVVEFASPAAMNGGLRLHDHLPDEHGHEAGRRFREPCRCLTCR
ncbi:hypothetical protein [Geotalea uraniireducens]|uniref:hypothetical protein n=1 Tax=Geotalea uraniireducens TaxID=351604 RepID=UPI002490852A|nr:hypothetical protein [Geotalea uraniireducens]